MTKEGLAFDVGSIKDLCGKVAVLRNGEEHVITGIRTEWPDCYEVNGGVHDTSCIARKTPGGSQLFEIVAVKDEK